MTTLQTQVGDRVRPCWNAVITERNAPPKVPARLGATFTVDAVGGGAVRIGGSVWVRSWLRIP